MTNLFFSLLIRFPNSAYLAWVDFWSQVRGHRRESLEVEEAPPATSDPTPPATSDRTSRQEVIESPNHG